MSENEFIQYRSDMAFLSLGGLAGVIVLTLLMRINFTGSYYIVLCVVLVTIFLYLFDSRQFYVPMLVGSSIYNGLNRVHLKPWKYFLLTAPFPISMVVISSQGVNNILTGLSVIYGIHMIVSHLINSKNQMQWGR